MAIVKRLIDARWLTSQMYLICEACQTENIFIDAIIDEIDNAPDVDAVEVVRCKDCKHFIQKDSVCNHFGYYSYAPSVGKNDFCSYGERRSDG